MQGKMECEIDRQIGVAPVAMQAFYWTQGGKACYIPALTCHGHGRKNKRIQANKMILLHREAGFTFTDRVRSSDIWSKGAAPSHLKEPVEVLRVSDLDASWEPSSGGFQGMFN